LSRQEPPRDRTPPTWTPVDWHELATKEDLTALEGRVDVRFDAVDQV
jgi:hypothetical protein